MLTLRFTGVAAVAGWRPAGDWLEWDCAEVVRGDGGSPWRVDVAFAGGAEMSWSFRDVEVSEQDAAWPAE